MEERHTPCLKYSWIVQSFLNYIEHRFTGIVAIWYDNLRESNKEKLTVETTLEGMLNIFVKYIEEEFVGKEWDEDKEKENGSGN